MEQAALVSPITSFARQHRELFHILEWYRFSNRTRLEYLHTRFAKKSMILRDVGEEYPVIYDVGPDHLSVRFYGLDYCLDAIGTDGVPDGRFKSVVQRSFRIVMETQQVYFDHVRGRCDGSWAEYDRAIIPLGDGFLASFLTGERTLRVLPGTSSPDLHES